MRTLPLYPGGLPKAAIETEETRSLDSGCTRCAAHKGSHHPCLPADGQGGGILVVGDSATREDDGLGRPLVGTGGRLIRALVSAHTTEKVVYDLAIRCGGSARDVGPEGVAACRGYLAGTYKEAAPKRVLTFGAQAAAAVTGRAIAPTFVRRGYQVLADGTPVFFLSSAAQCARNRFLRQRLEEDVRWALSAQVTVPAVTGVAYLVSNAVEAEEAVTELRAAGRHLSVDAETGGRPFSSEFRISTFSVCVRGEADAFVWTREACVAGSPALKPLLGLLQDKAVGFGGANVKFDLVAVMAYWGVRPRGVTWDSRLFRKLLDTDVPAKLEVMSELVGMGHHKGEMDEARSKVLLGVRQVLAEERRAERNRLKGKGPGPKPEDVRRRLAELGVDSALEVVVRDDDVEDNAWLYAAVTAVAPDVAYRYVARDAVSSGLLGESLEPAVRADSGLSYAWDRVVSHVTEALAQVEAWGIQIDTRAIQAFDSYLEGRQTEAEKALAGYSAGVDNWGSRNQLADYLFGRLGLPVVKLTDTDQASTDSDVLDVLRDKHPVIPHLIEWRQVKKLRGTYGANMLRYVRDDGRIHPLILPDGARSGRTSSTNPNCQNIPSPKRRPTEGRMARDVFVARPGWKLVQLDYSQIELRVAAMLSGDEDMKRIFQSGADFHQQTAELVASLAWRIAPSQVTEEHRALAKTVNFGILYGKKAGTLAREWGCSVGEAQRVMDSILGSFRGLNAWIKAKLNETRQTGYSWTAIDGRRARRRDMHRVAEPDDGVRSNAENGSANTPIQGTASDYLMLSLVECVRWIQEDIVPVRLILPVHDSLLFEVRTDAVNEVIGVAREIMTGQWTNGVPLLVDVEVGDRWGSIKKLKSELWERA